MEGNVSAADLTDLRQSLQSDLERLFQAIEPTIKDAEQHLGVAAGTLGDIRRDTDYLAIVKMHATIEPLLNEALEESVTRALTHPKVIRPPPSLSDVMSGLLHETGDQSDN